MFVVLLRELPVISKSELPLMYFHWHISIYLDTYLQNVKVETISICIYSCICICVFICFSKGRYSEKLLLSRLCQCVSGDY